MELAEWKHSVTRLIDERIKILSNKHITNVSTKTSLKNKEVKRSLENLHGKFVIVPIDKANGNVAIICKRFYIQVLIKELGIDSQTSTNSTYEYLPNVNKKALIETHSNFLFKNFKLNVDNQNQCLPSIYWIPKLHKNPSKARFIIAAPKCSLKPLSKSLTSAFKLIFKQVESYNKHTNIFSGVNSFWTILNNQPVINSINSLNNRGKATSISCFDFSTLYTTIPHDKLIKVLFDMIDFCFKGGDKQYIEIGKYGARWVNNIKL